VRKPALVCLCICFAVAPCSAVYSQQRPSPQTPQQAPPAAEHEKQTTKSPETTHAADLAANHSTPEDRKRLVTIAHKLEAAPLDPALIPEREWAVSWTVAVPDIHVRTCPALLADLRRPRHKYRSQLGAQLLISSAAFLIEHPEQADSIAVQSVGGMEGVLKAYSAIIKAEPQVTAKSLDTLLEKQREGKLADAVWEIVKSCQ
jgi:hypothetical protein